MGLDKNAAIKYERTLFEPEHELFRESYRAFLDRHVAPHHDQWEKDKIVDRGVWLEAGKQGFLGMAVPEEYGGGGNPDFRYNTIVVEETVAGRYSGLGFSLHNDVVAEKVLVARDGYGTERVRLVGWNRASVSDRAGVA